MIFILFFPHAGAVTDKIEMLKCLVIIKHDFTYDTPCMNASY